MPDWCPPPYEWHFYANPQPYVQYINAAIGSLAGAAVTYVLMLIARCK